MESGSQRILNLIHKDINLDKVFKVNEKLKKWQMGVYYHFMAGFPGETKEDLLETYRVMLELHDKYPRARFYGPSIYTPYPETPLYHRCIEMGFKSPEDLGSWARFEWDEKTCLPFITPGHSKWLIKSVDIVRRICIQAKALRWVGWWFRLRTKVMIKFNIIGPYPEEKLIYFVKAILIFTRKLFRVKYQGSILR